MTNKPQPMQSYDLLEVSGETGGYFVVLNGMQAPDDLGNDINVIRTYTPLLSFIALAEQCPFCKSYLTDCGNELPEEISGTYQDYHLWYCRRCRFWQWYSCEDPNAEDLDYRFYREGRGRQPGPDLSLDELWPEEKACISKLREFGERLPSTCDNELAQYLRCKPSEWHRYEPKRFEKLVADIFRANYADSEVIHVGKPDDGGVDIIFIDTEKQQWLVQVKRRERENSVECVNTIRNLIGTIVLEDAVRGIVVSTADHFSLRARQAAKRIERRGIYIDLIDRGILDRMLEPVLPDRPWLEILNAHDSEIASILSLRVPSDFQLNLFDFG